MAEELQVLSAEEFTDGLSTPCWLVRMKNGEGATVAHLFPQETLEWRSAEYGIDDVDELLDIVLHEPFQPPKDASAAAELGIARDASPTLFEAESTSEARDNHRARIARAKAERARVVAPKGKGVKDPLDVIRNKHGIDPARKRAKQELVDEHRWTKKYGELPAKKTPTTKTREVR